MIKLFSFNKKKKRAQQELAPQLTVWQRRALEFAGVPPAGLPYSTYDEMEKDSMIQTCLGVKKLGVLASEWRLVGDETANRRVDEPASRGEGGSDPHAPFRRLAGTPTLPGEGEGRVEVV